MVLDFSQGKIYKLTNSKSNKIYVGSTALTLDKRFSFHKSNYKRYLQGKHTYERSFDILSCPDVKIELLENFPCKRKQELWEREDYYKNKLKKYCINDRLAITNNKDYARNYMKKYNTKETCCYCGVKMPPEHTTLAKRHLSTDKHKNNIKVMEEIMKDIFNDENNMKNND